MVTSMSISQTSPGPIGAKPSSLSLATLARAAKRYSVWTFLFVLIALGSAAAVWFFLPLPKNTATVVFQIQTVQPYNISPVPDPHSDFRLYKQLQLTSLTSKNLMSSVLADPSVASSSLFEKSQTSEAITKLSSLLRSDFNLGPEFMRISLEGDNPEELKIILKAVSDTYLKEVVNKDKTRRMVSFEKLRRLGDKYLDELKLNRNRVREVMKIVGTGDPYAIQIRERFLESQIGLAHTQLSSNIASQRDSEVEMKVSQVNVATEISVPEAILNDLVKNDPEYVTTERERELVKQQLAGPGFQNYQPGTKSPKMIELEARLATLNQKLQQLPVTLKPLIEGKFKDVTQANEQSRADTMKNKMTLLKQMEKAIVTDIDSLLAKKQEFSSKQLELEGIRQEITQTEKTAEKIAGDIESLRTELDAPARVSMWEDVHVGPGIEGNRRLKYTAMTGIAVMLFGLGFIQFLDIRNRRITSPHEVTQTLGIPLLGTLPFVRRDGRGSKVDSAHVMTEAVNTTRTFLISTGKQKTLSRSVLVTSATSGEAKTSLATHLAVSIAASGRRVLLIDADMRRPAVHKVFSVPLSPGLADYLCARVPAFTDAIHRSQVDNLDILSAGSWRPEAPAGLTGPLWEQIIEHGTQAYDFVLVDSPPVLPVADALSIARSVDSVLLSVMQNSSRCVSVETAYHRLRQIGANVIGVIVSGVPSSGAYYYYDAQYSPRVVEGANQLVDAEVKS